MAKKCELGSTGKIDKDLTYTKCLLQMALGLEHAQLLIVISLSRETYP